MNLSRGIRISVSQAKGMKRFHRMRRTQEKFKSEEEPTVILQ